MGADWDGNMTDSYVCLIGEQLRQRGHRKNWNTTGGQRRKTQQTSSGVHPIMAPISVALGFSSFSSLLSSLSTWSPCCSTSPVSVSLLSNFGFRASAPFGTNVDAKTMAPSTVNCEARRGESAWKTGD